MYLFESELSENKRIKIALNSIYGLKNTNSQKIIRKNGFSGNFKLKLITNEQVISLVKITNSLNLNISSSLKKYKFSIFKKLIDIKSIKSFRLNNGLPVRGQRTHTNSKTARKKLHLINANLTMFTNLLNFNLICFTLILSSTLVVFSSHVIFALFFLVLSFIFASILLLILECEFLALMFIIIYVGAIAVLFLFLIMMIDIKFKNLSKNIILYFSTGSIFMFLFFALIFEKITNVNEEININKTISYNYYLNWGEIIWCLNEVQVYSLILYSFYILQFLITGLILLVVFIAIVHFTKIKLNKQHQSILKQISLNSKLYV